MTFASQNSRLAGAAPARYGQAMSVSETDIALAQRLADAAGAAIRPRFRTEHGLEPKPDHSPVTLGDREA